MAPPYESYRVTLSFAIEKDVLDKVDTFARRNERSRSSMIRMVLREWVLNEIKLEEEKEREKAKWKKSIYEREQEEVEKKGLDKERAADHANRPPTGNVFDIADSDD